MPKTKTARGTRAHVGTVYLLHFSQPYFHARHYVGFTRNLDRRLDEHRRGAGSPLIRAAVRVGIEVFVARRWEHVTRAFERRIHRRPPPRSKGCPICRGRPALRVWLPYRDPDTGVGI
jgi:predicted GIY-YIG superfamily endonuclease